MAYDGSLDQTIQLKLGIEPTDITKRGLEELGALTRDLEEALAATVRVQGELVSSVPGVADLVESTRVQQAAVNEALNAWSEQQVEETRNARPGVQPTQAPVPAARLDSPGPVTDGGGAGPVGVDPASGVADAIRRAQAQASLHARRLDETDHNINVLAGADHLLDVLPDLRGENGSLGQQAAATARTVVSRMLDQERRPVGARVAAEAAGRGIDLGKLLSRAPEGEAQPGSAVKLLEEIRDNTAATSKPAAGGAGSASGQARLPSRRPSQPAPGTPAGVIGGGQEATVEGAVSQLREAVGLNGRGQTDVGGDLLKRAHQVSNVGRGLSQASQALSRGASAAEGAAAAAGAGEAGLVTAGAAGARGAATGLGALGSTVSGAGSMLAGAATKVAAPLAVASLAYDGLNAAGDAWVAAQQSGNIDGGYGGSAVWQGVQNNVSDWWRGLNPFSSVSSSDFARYREQIAGLGYGITQDSDAARTLSNGMATAQDMGIDSRTVLNIFGRAVKEDPDFDLDESLKDLADAAKDSALSLKDFAQATADNTKLLEEGLGVDSAQVVDISTDLTAALTDEGGVESDAGILGSKAAGEAYVNKALTADTQQNYQLLMAATRAGVEGIDMGDALGSTNALIEYLNTAENGNVLLNELLEDAATYNLGNISSDSAYRQALSQLTGVSVGGKAVNQARRQAGQEESRNSIDVTVNAGPGLEVMINEAIAENQALNGDADYGSSGTTARESSGSGPQVQRRFSGAGLY